MTASMRAGRPPSDPPLTPSRGSQRRRRVESGEMNSRSCPVASPSVESMHGPVSLPGLRPYEASNLLGNAEYVIAHPPTTA
eukprot:1191954-Prorocentrum_minimum.AAC.2